VVPRPGAPRDHEWQSVNVAEKIIIRGRCQTPYTGSRIIRLSFVYPRRVPPASYLYAPTPLRHRPT
jgi:hypothetical protein